MLKLLPKLASPSPKLYKLCLNANTSSLIQKRFVSESIVKVPAMGESINEGTLTEWHKCRLELIIAVGDSVGRDELIATIETDKIDVQVNSTESGKILEQFAQVGDTVAVGSNLAKIEIGEHTSKVSPKETKPAAAKESKTAIKAKEAEPKVQEKPSVPKQEATSSPQNEATKAPQTASKPVLDLAEYAIGSRKETTVKMNRMRLRIAERLKEAQNTAASLTTFNEIDMSALVNLRKKYKDVVLEKHGIKLGFMGAFLKASAAALHAVPAVNARIEDGNMIYSDFVDVSVAVSTPKGLVTPVLRNCESKTIIQLEKDLSELGKKAKSNAITLEDMAGGTFTISNGGVFGSLYGTPIINTPQSAILGMHAVKDRAVVVDGQVVVRPMMYVALTYDHRIIDGREAVTFLVKVKEAIEDPARLLLDV